VDPALALAVTLSVVAVGAVLGVLSRRSRGRSRPADGSAFLPGDLPGLSSLAPAATLVQFSTEFCSSCPGSRRLLTRLATEREGIEYLDVDLTNDADLARRLRILQTPTVFVLDAQGRLAARFGGAPRPQQVTDVVDALAAAP
jgi:thiol-disulfide isomerase/thioredoxin